MNNKRKKILATILLLLMLGAPSSVYAYNSYNYNKFYNQGLANVNSIPLIEVEASWVVSPSGDKFTKLTR